MLLYSSSINFSVSAHSPINAFVKKIKSILLLFFFAGSAFAQYNEWTWMKGSNLPLGAAVTGIKGVPNINNTPGSSYESVEWTDNNGIFWLLDNSYNFWKYDPATNMWTWINNGPTSWGVQGIPSALNFPGTHGFGALSWTDKNNDLWLYAGTQTGWDSNLWKYNIASGMWTWMKGPGTCSCSPRVYGIKGVPAAANNPGSRAEVSCSWIDATGNLWFFGGQACNGNCGGAGTNGGLSDVWKYDIGTNNWTWMSGPNIPSQASVYGTKGVASGLNTPGGRFVFTSGKQVNGEFLVFGGNKDIGVGTDLNDTWKYNSVTDQWTWLSGPNLSNQPAVYGTKCVPSAANVPGSGREVRIRWTDDCGNLWLFGTGFFGTFPTVNGGVNDLWRYSIKNNTWTWVSGSNVINQPGVYGIMGISSPANVPGSRKGGNAWRTKTDFYLFGGYGYTSNNTLANYNDLWRYKPDKPTALFSHIASGGCTTVVNFTNNSTPGCNEIKSYAWSFGDPGSGINDTSSVANPSHTFSNNGTYSVKLVVTNCTGSQDSITKNIAINTGGIVATLSGQTNPVCNGGTGTVSVGITGGSSPYNYTWSNGQTSQTGTGLAAGNYTITISDAAGCTTTIPFSVVSPPPIIGQFTKGTANCSDCGCKEWIMVTASGGTSPYTYSWSTPAGFDKRYKNNLCPGTYNINLKDKNGCNINVSLNTP